MVLIIVQLNLFFGKKKKIIKTIDLKYKLWNGITIIKNYLICAGSEGNINLFN